VFHIWKYSYLVSFDNVQTEELLKLYMDITHCLSVYDSFVSEVSSLEFQVRQQQILNLTPHKISFLSDVEGWNWDFKRWIIENCSKNVGTC
jgi:hypothetical protein